MMKIGGGNGRILNRDSLAPMSALATLLDAT